MKAWRGLIILIVLVLLSPVLVKLVSTAIPLGTAFERALANGSIRWEPVSGTIIERPLPGGGWEQEVLEWHGAGTMEGRVSGGERVWLKIPYDYSWSGPQKQFHYTVSNFIPIHSDDSFPGLLVTGKTIAIGEMRLYLAEGACLRLRSDLMHGSKTLSTGTDLVWKDRRWSVGIAGAVVAARADRLKEIVAGVGAHKTFEVMTDGNGSSILKETVAGAGAHTVRRQDIHFSDRGAAVGEDLPAVGPKKTFVETKDILQELATRGPEPQGQFTPPPFDEKYKACAAWLSVDLDIGPRDPDDYPSGFALAFKAEADSPKVDFSLLMDRRKLQGATR